MRITTQMLNESARKAGLPINRSSLLNYVNRDGSNNGLLGALNQKQSSAVQSAQKTNYGKLEKNADQLARKAALFTEEGEKSVFENARKSGSNREIYDSVEELIESYNSTFEILDSMEGTLDTFYSKNLTGFFSDNKEALQSIGITMSKNGTLNLDKEKLQAADLETLEKVLGNASGIMKKLSYLAGRISDNAQTNVESLGRQYSSGGNSYTSSFNKYDFWG